jgi:hypothetical protein
MCVRACLPPYRMYDMFGTWLLTKEVSPVAF